MKIYKISWYNAVTSHINANYYSYEIYILKKHASSEVHRIFVYTFGKIILNFCVLEIILNFCVLILIAHVLITLSSDPHAMLRLRSGCNEKIHGFMDKRYDPIMCM